MFAPKWNDLLLQKFNYTAPGNGIHRNGNYYDAETNTNMLYVAYASTNRVESQYFNDDLTIYYTTISAKRATSYLRNLEQTDNIINIVVGNRFRSTTVQKGTIIKRYFGTSDYDVVPRYVTETTEGVEEIGQFQLVDYDFDENDNITFTFVKI